MTTVRLLCGMLVALALLGGCATVRPGADYPRVASTALAHPEETALGRKIEPRARAHDGLSAFRLLPTGSEGFVLRAQMIYVAERTLDVQYYAFEKDYTGELLMDSILRAAGRGVRVRMLIDDSAAQGEDDVIKALTAHPNIQVRMYNPFWYRGSLPLLRIADFALESSRLDYRMHNKVMIADNELALTGGRNVGDEYFDNGKTFSFGDYDVLSLGPIARDLSKSFDQYWNSSLSIPAEALYPGTQDHAKIQAVRQALAQHKADARGDDLMRQIRSGNPLRGYLATDAGLTWAHAQAIYDSPDKANVQAGEAPGRLFLRHLMEAAASVQSELIIVSPYFVPGHPGEKLIESLRKRGVRVRILTNSLSSTDVPAVHAGYMRYRRALLEDGVELYEVKPMLGQPQAKDGLLKAPSAGQFALHAKVYVFDRARVFVGSANFDQRSFHLNTEMGLMIDSPVLARQVIERFEAIATPENSYVLSVAKTETAPQIVWTTEQDDKIVETTVEPAKDRLRQFGVDLLSLLPLDNQL